MIRIVVGPEDGQYTVHWHDGTAEVISSFCATVRVAWRILWSGQKVTVQN